MSADFTATAAAIFENNSATKETDEKYLTFWTDGQLFGVSIADVVQIVGMQPITAIPEYPSYAKGIINLRGTIIPMVDIRLRLGKEEAEYTERTCTIVIGINDTSVGLIVDSVDEVTKISNESVSPPPKIADGYVEGYITGIAKLSDKVVLLLDTAKIFGGAGF